MQATINLAQALLEQGREFWEQDRYAEATQVFSRLLGLRHIPARIAERAQFYLGDMQLAQGHYTKARRHLAAALATGTTNGETHFLMARALDWDEKADPRHAHYHYRRAMDLEPGQPLYSSAYALTRVQQKRSSPKQDHDSLRRLRDAFAADPDDPDIVYNYVSGLLEMDRVAEAELALARARKRWPCHPAFEELWYDLLVRRGLIPAPKQEHAPMPRLRVISNDEPVLLPFPDQRAEPAAVRQLRPNSRLGTAIESLDDAELATLGRALGLPPARHSRERRAEIRRALLDRDKLEPLVAGLSTGSQYLLRMLSDAGGSAELKSLRLRVDRPAVNRPHIALDPAPGPLDELRRTGLVFTTRAGRGRPASRLAAIPTDLRKALRELLKPAQ